MVDIRTRRRCINCRHRFVKHDVRGYYGHYDIGPFCETCYRTIKLHEAEPKGTLAGDAPIPCGGCGGPHPFDTSVPSVLWNRVIRAKNIPEYLCTTCIVREFAKAGVSFTATLWGDKFNGLPVHVEINGAVAGSAHALNEENSHLRSELYKADRKRLARFTEHA
jgi:hypothetical protein